MTVPIRTLKVRPNPWIEIDPRGLPCGRVIFEPSTSGAPDMRYGVGASVPQGNVQRLQDAPKGVMLGQEIDVFEVKYSEEDVLVPNTAYYRRRIIRGELIAADKSTYVAAGGSAKGFEEQDSLLDAIKAQAIRDFDAANGEGAFEALAEHREQLKQEAADVKAAAAADQDPKVLTDVELQKLARAQQPAPEPGPAPALSTKPSDSKKGDAQ